MVRFLLFPIALVIFIFPVVAALQPDSFIITRSQLIDAPPETVFTHVNDLTKWHDWSPWAKIDPNAKETFSGPQEGAGAVMQWEGNIEVGSGRMTIVTSVPAQLVRFRLAFFKPLRAIHTAEFTFKKQGTQTLVTWSMSGRNDFVGKAMGLIFNCEKMVGGQFEKGLLSLQAISEGKKAPKA